MNTTLKKTVFVFALTLTLLVCACKKNPAPITTPGKIDRAEGKYQGIISTTISYTSVNGSPAKPNEYGTYLQTVVITRDSIGYYLDGKIMSGGPSIYNINSDGNYYLDTSAKIITFSNSSSRQYINKLTWIQSSTSAGTLKR